MLLSKLIGERTKEVSQDAKLKSHQLLLRAGYMKQVSNGIYTLTSLGQKACFKIENIIRKHMNKIDGQEVKFPVVMPREMWDLSGRFTSIGNEMVRFKDRFNHDMLLGMTHEEAAVHLCKNWVNSYNQLPFMIYQIQTKFRDEARSRGGLIRVREFTMKDAYSFHENQEDLENYYQKAFNAYNDIYKEIGLKNFISVKSDSGMMGGSISHEFMSINENGEDELIICDKCGFTANQEVAECVYENEQENSGDLEKVYTGSAHDIEEVCKFLNVDANHTIKAVAFAIKNSTDIVCCFVRGDREINEAKLKKVIGKEIAPCSVGENEGFAAGNIGPINLQAKCTVLFDNSLKNTCNMVCGANEKDYHLKGVDVNRDLKNIEFVDISKVKNGEICPNCKNERIHIEHGIEIGNIFQLGTKYTKSMDMQVLNKDGESFNPIMGCYGIGVGRNLACIIEDNSDDYGIVMPKAVAPYLVHICPLRLDDENVHTVAYNLYNSLKEQGIDVLFDDRNVNPGTKFAEADLMGMPFRVVISPKGLAENICEIKIRETGEVIKVDKDELVKVLVNLING